MLARATCLALLIASPVQAQMLHSVNENMDRQLGIGTQKAGIVYQITLNAKARKFPRASSLITAGEPANLLAPCCAVLPE